MENLVLLNHDEWTNSIRELIHSELEDINRTLSEHLTNASKDLESLLTTKEVCALLKISKVTLIKYRTKGLPYYRMGREIRYKKNEILDYMKHIRRGLK